jgi:D-3-phosphoglycerate dehydrogenase / 2-oxoglutarate reductase
MPPSALTENIKIQNANGGAARKRVTRTESTPSSPSETLHSPPQSASWGSRNRHTTGSFGASAAGSSPLAKLLKPFKEEDIKILLLENVNQTGKDILSQQGYQVESLKSSLPEDQLIEKIKYVTIHSPFFLAFMLMCIEIYMS